MKLKPCLSETELADLARGRETGFARSLVKLLEAERAQLRRRHAMQSRIPAPGDLIQHSRDGEIGKLALLDEMLALPERAALLLATGKDTQEEEQTDD